MAKSGALQLEGIEISNFRGIKSCSINALTRVNVLIGPNNSCKSTVLESVWMISKLLDNKPHEGLRNLLDRRARRDAWNAKELWFTYDPVQDIRIKLVFKNMEPMGVILRGDFGFERFTVSTFKGAEVRGYCDMDASLVSCTKTTLLIPSDVTEVLSRARLIDRMILDSPGEMEQYPADPRASSRLQGLLQKVGRAYVEDLEDLGRMQYTRAVEKPYVSMGGRRFFLDDTGDGMRQALYVLSLMVSSKPTIFLLEEVETHQHPAALRDLIRLFVETAKATGHQLILTTHSPDVFGVCNELGEDVCTFRLTRNSNGVVFATKLEGGSLKQVSDLGLDVGGLIRYRTFVIVEGDCDALTLRLAAQKLGTNLRERAIDILPVGGRRAIAIVTKSVLKMGARALVVVDLDDKTKETAIESVWSSILSDNSFKLVGPDRLHLSLHPDTRNAFEKSCILPVGTPDALPGIVSHSMDDYLVQLVKENRSEFGELEPGKFHQLEEAKAIRAKDLLASVFGYYGRETVTTLFEKAKVLPRPLSEMVEQVTSLAGA